MWKKVSLVASEMRDTITMIITMPFRTITAPHPPQQARKVCGRATVLMRGQ